MSKIMYRGKAYSGGIDQILTKDILYSGQAKSPSGTATTSISLSNSLENYQFLEIVYCALDSSNGEHQHAAMTIPVSKIQYATATEDSKSWILDMYKEQASPMVYASTRLCFANSTSTVLTEGNWSGWGGIAVTDIYGVKISSSSAPSANLTYKTVSITTENNSVVSPYTSYKEVTYTDADFAGYGTPIAINAINEFSVPVAATIHRSGGDYIVRVCSNSQRNITATITCVS